MFEKEYYSVIGKPQIRVDAEKHVKGSMEYVGDMHLPQMLYAKGVYSVESHARIKSVDVSEARCLPGVHAVVTSKDIPYNRIGLLIRDTPVLAENKVHYQGEMIAAVAAESDDIACRAATLVRVEYEKLPVIFDPRAAMKSDAPIINEFMQGNGYNGNIHTVPSTGEDYHRLRCGDVEQGFNQSDIIIEKSFASSPQKPAPIENLATVASPSDMGGVTIWTTHQSLFTGGGQVADALKLPYSKVRLICPALGGGFGGKSEVRLEPVTAVLAIKTGRPVKFALNTHEDFAYSGTKHPMYFDLKIGAKKDGKLIALKSKVITGAGPFRSVSVKITEKLAAWGSGPYHIPNQYTDCYVVSTNRQPGCSFRGFGLSQNTFALETMMNILADHIQMHPLELRKINLYRNGDKMATGQTVRSFGMDAVIEKVETLARARE